MFVSRRNDLPATPFPTSPTRYVTSVVPNQIGSSEKYTRNTICYPIVQSQSQHPILATPAIFHPFLLCSYCHFSRWIGGPGEMSAVRRLQTNCDLVTAVCFFFLHRLMTSLHSVIVHVERESRIPSTSTAVPIYLKVQEPELQNCPIHASESRIHPTCPSIHLKVQDLEHMLQGLSLIHI